MKGLQFMPGELLEEFKADPGNHMAQSSVSLLCLFVVITLIMTILLPGTPTSVTSIDVTLSSPSMGPGGTPEGGHVGTKNNFYCRSVKNLRCDRDPDRMVKFCAKLIGR